MFQLLPEPLLAEEEELVRRRRVVPIAPGKRTRTQRLARAEDVAADGVADAVEALPHRAAIQRAFGPHDLSGIAARVGGEAADAAGALDAEAYAYGERIGFARAPDLFTAAHEVAHVVQQRARVAGPGLGAADDQLERDADAIASRVVRGEPAIDLLPAPGPRAAAPAAVQRKHLQGAEAKTTKNQGLSIQKILAEVKKRGSPVLVALLTHLEGSPCSHFQLDVITRDGTLHGDTGIYLGCGATDASPLVQEQVLLDPTPLCQAGAQLTVRVRIFVNADRPPHEIAATILHELELHAVRATQLVGRLETLRTGMGSDPDKVVGTIFQFMQKADDHGDLSRLVNLVETAARLRDACADNDWAGWAKAVFATVCQDAIEHLATANTPADVRLQQMQYLKAKVAALGGAGPSPGAMPDALGPATIFRDVRRAAPAHAMAEDAILDFMAVGVRARRDMTAIIEELATTHGVDRARAVALYDQHIAPQIYVEARGFGHGDPDLIFTYGDQYGVPRPVMLRLMEEDERAAKGGSGDDEKGQKKRKVGGDGDGDGDDGGSAASARGSGGASGKAPPKLELGKGGMKAPSERSFWTGGDEDDWTPITNRYVPRAVLAAHADLARGQRIVVDGFLMRVGYTDDGSVAGASKVPGPNENGKYMALRMALKGG